MSICITIMLAKIVKEYKHILLTILQLLFLVSLCIALGVLIVLPLWKWATSARESYSALIIAIILLFALYNLVKSCIKMDRLTLLRRALQIGLTAFEVYIFISQVFRANRLFAFISLFVYALVISFVSLSLKNLFSKSENVEK